eukprot:TRINITY_DN9933_c0_g1_i1.p1 TRINITY_DN9933_c0_g1~~TRINITY_DN9933_c0_g1_i1.p1  ORF type:complete len:617 (+),score=112.94 TRINITY_DN9933_c0_g1_i1:60-1853(+)
MLLYCRLSSSFPPSSASRLLFPFKKPYSSLTTTTPSPSLSPSSPSIVSLICSRPLRSRTSRTRAYATAALATVQESKGSESFFADEAVTWKSLGVSDQLCTSLSNVGLHKPSLVQAACIPHILSGNDVVVAAETGSGKTHGYLVPLIDKICGTSDPHGIRNDSQESPNPYKCSVILCPNVMLCEQVVRMASCLCDGNGEPLLRISAVCGRQGWPVSRPEIIVSTPAALLNCLFALDPEKRRRTEFIRDVKYVVFDEADMLLCGSFQNQVIRLINMFRFDEKLLSKIQDSKHDPSKKIDVDSMVNFEEEDEEVMQSVCNSEEDDDGEVGDADLEDLVTVESKVEPNKRKDWRRVRRIYVRSKQYIFVAATLPENGKKTAGGVLKRMFPEAIWVSGSYLHCHNPRLDQRWIEVTTDTQVDALIDAVKQGSKPEVLGSGAGVSRTMVFANTVDAVESVARILLRVGIECISYHRDSSLEERAKNLSDFQERGGVLVCTDSAARGLDVQNVSHVIQAEFATSAVDFLHRIGRTARAGQSGLVTSLYTESNRDLVAAVCQAGRLGQPVENAFSRKRGFRKKIKKKGSRSIRDSNATTDRVLA